MSTLKEVNAPLNFAIGVFGSLTILLPAFHADAFQGRNNLTSQRQKFEEHLNYLDNEVRNLFTLNKEEESKLEVAVA